LVTHQIQFLADVEKILVIDENTIKLEGNYNQLKEQGMDFDEMLKAYQPKEEEKGEDEIIFDEEEEEPHYQSEVSQESLRIETKEDNLSNSMANLKSEQQEDIKDTKELIMTEKVDKGVLTLRDWWNFYKYGTGVIGLISTLVFTICGAFLFLCVGYVVGLWTRKDLDEQQKAYYFHLFYLTIVLYFTAVILRALIICFSALLTSKNLHSLMIYKVFRAPIRFFDITPIGRILTRTAQDIGVFDNVMPLIANFVLNNMFRAISIVILMCVAVPFILVPALLVLFLALWIRKVVILPQND